MKAVLDANVLSGYFKEVVLEIPHELSDSPCAVLDAISLLILDDSGHIQQEYQSMLDRQWVNSWIISLVDSDRLVMISVDNHQNLKRAIERKGFPKGSRDIWYLRTALSAAQQFGCTVYLVTEDMDFFDPSQKKCAHNNRERIINGSTSPIQKHLVQYNVTICCVSVARSNSSG